MHVIKTRNVHEVLPEAIRHLLTHGERRESRNGPVLVSPVPVATVYERPLERVEFWPQRDSNPTFHLMEALWMLGGRNDVAFPRQFNTSFGQFSDDGVTFNGAYGFRWRQHNGMDQLRVIADRLRANPDDRRQVLSMWDPTIDLTVGHGSKDIPCNTHAYFTRRSSGELDMTVCCRSNDIIWGAYGANAVHFSFLLEYMAHRIGCPPGRYTQVSNNWHGYHKTLEPLKVLADEAALSPGNATPQVRFSPYRDEELKLFRLMDVGEDVERFDGELELFLDIGIVTGVRSPFLRRVAAPLRHAYSVFADRGNPRRFQEAAAIVQQCQADDWRIATLAWLERRRVKNEQKERAE